MNALQRLLVVAAVGVGAGVGAASFAPWQFAVLVAWDLSAAIYIGWVWGSVVWFTAEETRSFATREDNSRVATSVLLLSASVASLVGTGFELMKARDAHTGGRSLLITVAVLTVALSWTLVHTVFALRYAHEYYTPPEGGIEFPGGQEPPDYRDFGYVAFTVAMTFQVSDTDISARRTRRTVTRHALLSYLFGAVILAVVVNVVASLINTS